MWIGLSFVHAGQLPQFQNPRATRLIAQFSPALQTRAVLLSCERLLQQFFNEYKQVPLSLADLRLFSRTVGDAGFFSRESCSTYDGFGQRFDYLRLDPTHFIMRSFGAENSQNSASSTLAGDEAIFKSGRFPTQSLGYQNISLTSSDKGEKGRSTRRPHLFPPALLLGADSPDGKWFARIFSDRTTGNRRLIIRSRVNRSLHLFAPHDAVEEFYWLPDSKKIIFSATGSNRYEDGAYLWKIDQNEALNMADLILEKQSSESPITQMERLPGRPDRSSAGRVLRIALGGIMSDAESSAVALVFIAPAAMLQIDPTSFFSPQNLRAFTIDKKTTKRRPLEGLNFSPTWNQDLLKSNVALVDHLLFLEAGSRAQRQWLELPMSGSIEGALVRWQEFAAKQADSPLFPYGLWYLSAHYGQFASQLKAVGRSREADVLRSFGVELSKGLATHPIAPGYLRGLAAFDYEWMERDKGLLYSFFNVKDLREIPKGI